MKTLNEFIFCCIFFLIVFSFIVSAELGKITTTERGWKVIHSTDTDYFVFYDDVGLKNTQICLLHKTATNQGQLPLGKILYDHTESQVIELHPQVKRINEINYFGYCYLNTNRNYLKFGEQSTIIEYQEQSKIQYIFEEKELNITLLKNSTQGFISFPEDIFVFYDGETYKFGANDTANTGVELYKYQVVSTETLYLYSELNQIRIINEGEVHTTDFSDICSQSSSGCLFNQIDENSIELIFNSESLIDPFIQVSPLSSNSLTLTTLDWQRVVLSETYNGTAKFSIYYTNGTLITSKSVATGLGVNARARVKARNSTEFAYYYFNANTGFGYFQFFDNNGNNLTSAVTHEQIGGTAVDFSLMFRDRYKTEDTLYIGYIDDIEGDLDIDIVNLTNYTITDYTIDNAVNPTAVLSNLLSCDFGNETLIVCAYFDDQDDDASIIFWDVPSKSIWLSEDVDNAVGTLNAQVSLAIANGVLGYLFYDFADQDVTIGFTNATTITPLMDIDLTAGASSRISMASTFSNEYNQNVFIASWINSIGGSINTSVYFSNGTQLYHYALSLNHNPTYPLFNVVSANTYLKNSMENGTYAFTYVNSTGSTLINFYYLNGTEYRAIIDITPPNYTNMYPPNATYTNLSSINFSLNATDNLNLSNGTIYIYNETGGLVNATTKNLTGVSAIFSSVYNFLTEGIYTWFVRIYDRAGHFVDTIIQTIIIDLNSPDTAYTYPTLQNGSITAFDFIEVNVSATDINLSSIEIRLYQNGTLNETITGSTSPLYHRFINLQDFTKYQFNATACDYFNQCTNLATREITINSTIVSSIDFSIQIEQYPYVDLNVSTLFEGVLTLLGNPIPDSNVNIFISKGTQNWTYPMTYNAGTGTYQADLTFTEEGTYYFTANSIHAYYGNNTISGYFYVKEPFYITLSIFEVKDTDADPYENDFSYVILYPIKSGRLYDNTMEQFVTPLLFERQFNESVFWAEYEDGVAVIKLWDDDKTYLMRLIDGQISFDSNYAKPEITKSYSTNIYLGNYTFAGNQSYSLYVTEKDITPYRWLFTWITIILIIVSIIAGVFCLFVIPQVPAISIIIGLVFPIILITLRIILYIWVA